MPEYKNPQSEPGMDKNILLVFLLMAVAIFGAQYYMRKYAPQPPQQQRSTARPVEQPIQPGAPSTPSAGAQVRTTEGKSAGRAAPAAPQQATSESETVIENDLYRITLTNRGAEVRSWILKKFFLEIAILTIWADKKVEQEELDFLKRFCHYLGFSDDDLENSMIIWSNLYELSRAAADSVVYR